MLAVDRGPTKEINSWHLLSTQELLCQWTSTIHNKVNVLVQYKADLIILIIISLKFNL
jgi:hypothetical protein